MSVTCAECCRRTWITTRRRAPIYRWKGLPVPALRVPTRSRQSCRAPASRWFASSLRTPRRLTTDLLPSIDARGPFFGPADRTVLKLDRVSRSSLLLANFRHFAFGALTFQSANSACPDWIFSRHSEREAHTMATTVAE